MSEVHVSPTSIHSHRDTQGSYFANATPGTTVVFAPGEYRFVYPDRLLTRASGTANSPLRFVSGTPHATTIIGTGGPRGETFVWENHGSHVEIQGFEVTSDGACRIGIYNLGAHSKVVGNKVHGIVSTNASGGGAGIDHIGEHSDTIGNLVFDIRSEIRNADGSLNTGLVHGIYHAVRGGRIWNNLCCGCVGGYGIHLWHVPRDVTVANNLVLACSKSGIMVGAGDQSSGPIICDNCLVVNNIIVGAAEFGLNSFASLPELLGPNNRYLHNLTFDCKQGPSELQRGIEQGTLVVDPVLVSTSPDGSGDYRLRRNSPCIDAGVPNGAPDFDYLGTRRPNGNAFDIGPFEFVADETPSSSIDSMEYLLPLRSMMW